MLFSAFSPLCLYILYVDDGLFNGVHRAASQYSRPRSRSPLAERCSTHCEIESGCHRPTGTSEHIYKTNKS